MNNTEALRGFLLDANKAGYASGTPGTKEPDGSTTIEFESGDYKMQDNFFGGEPYGGREVIFLEGKPIWIMVYYGNVDESVENVRDIYTFLQKALAQPPEDLPLRGPKVFEEGDLKYENSWQGELEKFSGKEIITRNRRMIYGARYLGGEVDKRGE